MGGDASDGRWQRWELLYSLVRLLQRAWDAELDASK